MQVIIKRVHEQYKEHFPVGTEHELSRRFKHCTIGIKSSVTGNIYDANEYTKSLGNALAYSDVFTKVNPNEILY